jgi:hypothetical protein
VREVFLVAVKPFKGDEGKFYRPTAAVAAAPMAAAINVFAASHQQSGGHNVIFGGWWVLTEITSSAGSQAGRRACPIRATRLPAVTYQGVVNRCAIGVGGAIRCPILSMFLPALDAVQCAATRASGKPD